MLVPVLRSNHAVHQESQSAGEGTASSVVVPSSTNRTSSSNSRPHQNLPQHAALHSLIVSRLIRVAERARHQRSCRDAFSRRHAEVIWQSLTPQTISVTTNTPRSTHQASTAGAVSLLCVTDDESAAACDDVDVPNDEATALLPACLRGSETNDRHCHRVCYQTLVHAHYIDSTVVLHELAPPFRVFQPVISNNDEYDRDDVLRAVEGTSFWLRLFRAGERDATDVLLRQVTFSSPVHTLQSPPHVQWPVKSVSCGRAFAVAVLDGSGAVVSWGNSNALGQLGQAGFSPPSRKNVFRSAQRVRQLGLIGVPVRPRQVDLPEHVLGARVACGTDHTMLLSQRGELWGWGSNAFGQLGPVLSSPSLSNTATSSSIIVDNRRHAVVDPYWQAAWAPVQVDLPKLLGAHLWRACGDRASGVRRRRPPPFVVDVACTHGSTVVLGVVNRGGEEEEEEEEERGCGGWSGARTRLPWTLAVAGKLSTELLVSSLEFSDAAFVSVALDGGRRGVRPQGVDFLPSGDDSDDDDGDSVVVGVHVVSSATDRRRGEGAGKADVVDVSGGATTTATWRAGGYETVVLGSADVEFERWKVYHDYCDNHDHTGERVGYWATL
jgi:hypothetical protein